MSVFKTQTLLTIKLDTKYAGLASASVTRILYKKPDSTAAFWNASVSGTNLVYAVGDNDINQVGMWEFQAYIEVGGLKGYGNIAKQQFDKPIL